MKSSLIAISLSVVFAVTGFAQQTQPSASDNLLEEHIVVPSSIAPSVSEFESSDIIEGAVIEGELDTLIESNVQTAGPYHSTMQPSVDRIATVGCVQVNMMPANCCHGSIILPVVYQQSLISPIPQTPTTPTPIASPYSANDIIQSTTPYISGELNTITPSANPLANQTTPFIQPNRANGQTIGTQISSPTTSSFAPMTGTTTTTNNFAFPSDGFSTPARNFGNCCPPTRGFGYRGGRFFRRFR